jgi:hypothetical protein
MENEKHHQKGQADGKKRRRKKGVKSPFDLWCFSNLLQYLAKVKRRLDPFFEFATDSEKP